MIYKVVDLFAGIGSMTKAFTEAGFNVIWANDWDKDAGDIYRHNNNEIKLVQDDIRRIDIIRGIPDCDILTTSAPVQGYSLTGNKKDAVENYLDIIFSILAVKQPQILLLETMKVFIMKESFEKN